jgi:Cellulase (glycosyl hydrolase family 5)
MINKPDFSLFRTLGAIKVAILFCASFNAAHAFDTLRLNEKTKLFNVFDQSVSIVGAKYVGWGKHWEWANVGLKTDKLAKHRGHHRFDYTGDVPKFDMNFTNAVEVGEDKISWDYQWQKKAEHMDAIGVGIEFSLNLRSPTFNGPQPDPELLPGNAGWSWRMADGQKIEVKFTPAAAKVFFERNQKNKIRVLFFDKISSGQQKTNMTVAVSGNKTKVAGPIAQNYGDSDQLREWPTDILAETASPVDLSFLNDAPAGKHGYVKAKGADLVFADGTPAKFWGGNIQAYALLSSTDMDIKVHAKRIAQLGFNLMRIHHHDSKWVTPNIFQNPKVDTLELSDKSMRKLDWWIHCLKEAGVYVWLDLHVERNFTREDGISGFDEIAKDKRVTQVKGYNYINESIQQKMQSFNEMYLNHVNAFDDVAYKNDPAIVALLITNENDLTHHFGSLFMQDKNVPEHRGLFERELNDFAGRSSMQKASLWQAWTDGNPKLFLNDLEHQFNQKMITHLRGLGAKSLIATTNTWGGMALNSLPSLTDGDLIDVHSYGSAEELSRNPRFNPSFISWIGAAQVTGKPLSVTEWNAGTFPVADRFTMPMHMASLAALQGWDAMMIYGYSQNKFDGQNKVGNFSVYNDPALIGLMPAAALLYRQNQVSPGKHEYALKFSASDFFDKKISPDTSKTLRTLLETSRFTVALPDTPALPWLKTNVTAPAASSTIVTDAFKDMIPEGRNFVESDTGELKHDWEKGFHTIDSPKAQVVSGWMDGKQVSLSQARFEIKTKKATLAVQSLDDKAVKQSGRILITVMARCLPSDDLLRYHSEPVLGEIAVEAPAKMSLYSVDHLGRREKSAKMVYDKGRYHINLNENNSAVHWYILSAD